MKTRANSSCRMVLTIGLFALLSSLAFGAGLAAIKEQTFHNDEGAKIVAYTTLTDSGVSVRIQTSNRTFTIARQQLAGKLDILASLPTTIMDESEIAPVRKALKEYQDFAARFPQSNAVLANHVTALKNCISEFESGKARYQGEWMPFAQANISKKTEEDAREAEALESTRGIREKMEFEAEQKVKGLAKYNGKWIPEDEARKFAARDQAELNLAADAANKERRAKEEERRRADEKKAADLIAAKSARRIKGVVHSVTREGLLVDSTDYSTVITSSLGSVGGGGNVYIPPDPHGKNRPARIEGVFFLTGHPKQEDIVDKDRIDVNAVEDGVYSYTSDDGAPRRVKKFRVIKTYQ